MQHFSNFGGESPCWEGYEQIGYKRKNGKSVPNCVKKKQSKPKDK